MLVNAFVTLAAEITVLSQLLNLRNSDLSELPNLLYYTLNKGNSMELYGL